MASDARSTVEFHAPRMGLTLATDFYGMGAIVQAPVDGEARASGLVSAGDAVAAVAGEDVLYWDFDDIMARLRDAPAPRRVTFLREQAYYDAITAAVEARRPHESHLSTQELMQRRKAAAEDGADAVELVSAPQPVGERPSSLEGATVTVPRFEAREDEGYVAYEVCVQPADPAWPPLRVWRRYSEFYALYCALAAAAGSGGWGWGGDLPPMPSGGLITYLWRFDPPTLEQRRAGFEEVLQAALGRPELAGLPEVATFLGSSSSSD